MTSDLRDAAADLLHAASERIRRQGHHQGKGHTTRPANIFVSRAWELDNQPLTALTALLVEAGHDPYEHGEHPAAVHLAVELWGAHLKTLTGEWAEDTDGFFDAPATVAAYEQAPDRTANKIAETMRVTAALAQASHINERKAATANATAQQGSAA